jgi:hypothetical protein
MHHSLGLFDRDSSRQLRDARLCWLAPRCTVGCNRWPCLARSMCIVRTGGDARRSRKRLLKILQGRLRGWSLRRARSGCRRLIRLRNLRRLVRLSRLRRLIRLSGWECLVKERLNLRGWGLCGLGLLLIGRHGLRSRIGLNLSRLGGLQGLMKVSWL